MKKIKYPMVIKDHFKIEFIPFQKSKVIGYIRLEDLESKKFLGAIDERLDLTSLKHLRRAINGFIRMKETSK